MVNGALSISSLTLSDTGMFQCIAENRHGRVFANAELKVIGKELLVTKDIATHILKYIANLHLARLYKVCFVLVQQCMHFVFLISSFQPHCQQTLALISLTTLFYAAFKNS